MHFLSRLRRTADRHAMLPASGRVVVAVSGGPDSMALLEGLVLVLGEEARARLLVAHLDHGLREAAPLDAEFVRDEARRRGLQFALGREDVGALARDGKLSVEEAARTARYAFLEGAAREAGAGVVALGHTADDNAETVFLNVFRGAGLRGLAGIRPARLDTADDGREVRFVRPLIELTRPDIETFLRERRIPFRTDETNAETRFRRNLVRHELLPAVRLGLQPRTTEVLCRLAGLAAEARDFMEGEAARSLRAAGRGGEASLSRAEWDAIPPALRGNVLRLMFERASGGRTLSQAHVEAMRDLAESSGPGETDLPGGWVWRVGAGSVDLAPPTREEPGPVAPWRLLLEIPGSVRLPDGGVLTAALERRLPGQEPPRRTDPSLPVEWADYDALGRPRELVVRSREAGDVFRPLGSGGARSVKRFLIDAKVPRQERARVPIVAAADGEGEIIWVAPLRLAECARLTGGTREVLALRLEPAG